MRLRNVFVGIVLTAVVCAVVFVTFGGMLPFGSAMSDRCVAKVGSSCLSFKDYSAAYQGELSYIESVINQKLSEDDIKRFGVKEMTLGRMIDDMALEKFAKELRFQVSSKSIRDLVGDMPVFQGKNGKFDEQRFRDLLSDAGITEASYIGKVRASLPAFVLSECIFPRSGPAYLQHYAELAKDVLRGIMQSRTVDVVEISPDAIQDPPAPADSDLEVMYNDGVKNGDLTMPEYRSAKYMIVSEDDSLDEVVASDSEVENEIKNSELHDQRDVLNLVFPSESEAIAAFKSLKEGKTFESVVKEVGTTVEAITLKNVTKELLPVEVRGAIFALNDGEVSEVFRSVVGWHIMKILNRHKISKKDLEKLKEKVALGIRRQKARELFSTNIRKANEIISRGATEFSEVESIFKKPSSGFLQNFDISGNDAEGRRHEYAEGASFPALIEALPALAFSSQVDKPSHFVSIGNAYFSVIVTSVVPTRTRTLEESKSLLLEKWKNTFVLGEMRKLASNFAAKLKAGESLQNAKGITTKKGESISREGKKSKNTYPGDLVDRVFDMNVGDVSDGILGEHKVFVVMLKEIKTPDKVDDKELKEFQNHFVGSAMSAIRGQLLNRLTNKYKVRVNRKLLERI
ncbi:peptidylprolyl isomerase [Anaplasma capra]|uniref:peptidylprolyl isomerase n=1 Tax=Anaplasma capra TaxID=1562740 RepID=UPI0021D5DCF4|nr:peptidylprolyl isomerase [Anaplasma capra]MCU7611874.1 SurA N-terminal domain-containing protein [Anaplasma capra]MCU7612249.1 SurA N-terminal domain-containing protein [Anaplasma capra]